MYSGSRGILYTAPPAADESNENQAETGTADAADEESGPAATAESTDALAADD